MGFPQTLKTLILVVVSIKLAVIFFLLRGMKTHAKKINGQIAKMDKRIAKMGTHLNRMNHRIDEMNKHMIKKLLERG